MALDSKFFLLLTAALVTVTYCNRHGKVVMQSTNKSSSGILQSNTPTGWRCSEDSDCPLWAYCNDSYCRCRQSFENSYSVKCSDNSMQLSVRRCSCVTYTDTTEELIVGACIESCGNVINNYELYFKLPQNLSELNHFTCTNKWNRTGRLCGKCLPGHAPLAYSYDMRCVSCPEGNKNIWKYLLMAYGPLTIFYFIVLFFKINATSSYLHGYLYFSQSISTQSLVRNAYLQQNSISRKLEFNILIAFYSIWNLDILRSLHPEICLNVSTLTLFAMDYALVLYPLLLTVISYILIELHDKDYRVIVYLWKPFRYVFTFVRRSWNIRTTVIDSYATFFLLSFVKVLNITVDMLTPAILTDLTNGTTTWVLFYDGTVDYFGSEHLPYAILAIVFCIVFTIIPMLLLTLYPFRWFQRLISHLKLQGPLLQTIMDSFQGFYKDGTESGTRDYRWFAAMPLFARLPAFCLITIAPNSSYFPWATVLVFITLLLIIIIQPYKASVAHYTKIDAVFLGSLGIVFAMVDSNNLAGLLHQGIKQISETLLVIFTLAPLIYMVCITLYWIFTHTKKGTHLIKSSLRACFESDNYSGSNNENDIPDRLVHPELYTEYMHLNNTTADTLSSKSQEADTY